MTPEGIASINALESRDALVALVRLTHPAWADDVRLAQSPTPIVHGGLTYDPAPFDLGLPSSEETGQPSLDWTIGNAGEMLIDRLDLGGNAGRIEATVSWIFDTRPNVVEFGPCRLYLASAEVQRETVAGALSVSPVEELAHGKRRFNLADWPALG